MFDISRLSIVMREGTNTFLSGETSGKLAVRNIKDLKAINTISHTLGYLTSGFSMKERQICYLGFSSDLGVANVAEFEYYPDYKVTKKKELKGKYALQIFKVGKEMLLVREYNGIELINIETQQSLSIFQTEVILRSMEILDNDHTYALAAGKSIKVLRVTD